MEKKSTLVTCAMIASALLSVSAVKATTSLLEYNALGTAGEVRTSLVKSIEATCGEKKAETKDTKTKDAKCGEKKAKDAKCGEKKAKDGKCGEGKCGEKKGEKKKETEKPH
jgi:uncharacterized low-complexity protein